MVVALPLLWPSTWAGEIAFFYVCGYIGVGIWLFQRLLGGGRCPAVILLGPVAWRLDADNVTDAGALARAAVVDWQFAPRPDSDVMRWTVTRRAADPLGLLVYDDYPWQPESQQVPHLDAALREWPAAPRSFA